MHAVPPTASPPENEVLGLDPVESDPVRIILAAQLQLRRLRLGPSCGRGGVPQENVRQIVAARDVLLRRAVGALANRGLGGGRG